MKILHSPLITAVFAVSLVWWIYLGLHTQMQISCDAIDYEQSGRLLNEQGFVPAYFHDGPRREPLYPLFVAAAMQLADTTGHPYTRIMAGFGVLVLLLSQILLYVILRRLKTPAIISAAILAYFAFSPAITNSAFSLYSEILTYPFVLGIVLVSVHLWQAIEERNLITAVARGIFLGFLFAGLTLSKGAFECIFPIYLFGLLATLLKKTPAPKPLLPALLCGLAALIIFYAPILQYKQLNLKYNGVASITNRWPWMVYGSSVRRTEASALTHLPSALAYTPGEGLCTSVFGPQECDLWSFTQTDTIGMQKLAQLKDQGLAPQAINSTLTGLSAQKVLQNPLQYGLFSVLEALKLVFWESTQIGFVSYPAWLSNIYNNKLFNNLLRLSTAVMTMLAIVLIWRRRLYRCPIILSCSMLMFVFMFCMSFVSILTRYALPIVPLYLICIACAANSVYTKRHDQTTV